MTIYKLLTYIGLIALLLTALRYFVQGYKKVLLSFIENFVGSFFLFSGFVKAVDPMGTSIKMHEYFEAMHIEFFNVLSTPLTIAMLVAELSLGLAVLVGYKPKITTSLLLLLNVFFMLLTGFTFLSGYEPTNAFFIFSVLACALVCAGAIIEYGTARFWLIVSGFGIIIISLGLMKFTTLLFTHSFDIGKMKVTDCGCFGDFMKLKPWQTFYKDVMLSFMVLILAIRHKHIQPALGSPLREMLTYAMVAISFIFCLRNAFWNEPFIDFRPYAVGEDININRIAKKPEVRDMIFTYKNKFTGAVCQLKKDSLGRVTENDTCLGRVDVILDEGIPARISNLFIFNEDGADLTDSLLHDPQYTLVVVAPILEETQESVFKEKLNPIAEACDKAHIKIYALTKDLDAAEAFRHRNQTAYPFYTTDDAAIKAMMRSNPGLMLLRNGVVINKWHYRHLPSFDELNSVYFSKK